MGKRFDVKYLRKTHNLLIIIKIKTKLFLLPTNLGR